MTFAAPVTNFGWIFIVALILILGGWYILIHWREFRARLGPKTKTGAGNYSPALFVEIDGFKVHYVQEGRGPDLLLVHGLGGALVCWAVVFRELKKYYRVTAVDLPGFGRSDKRRDREYGLDEQTGRLALFIETLKLERPFVVGHSMGGAIATWLAKTRPTLVRKLLLIAPALNYRIVAVHPGLLSLFLRPTHKFLMSRALVRWIYTRRVLKKIPANVEELVDEYHRPYQDDGSAIHVFLRHAHLLRDKRLPAELKDLTTPARILIGAYDVVFPQRYLKRFTTMNPRIETVIVPDCGHQLMEEAPELLVRQIRDFLI